MAFYTLLRRTTNQLCESISTTCWSSKDNAPPGHGTQDLYNLALVVLGGVQLLNWMTFLLTLALAVTSSWRCSDLPNDLCLMLKFNFLFLLEARTRDFVASDSQAYHHLHLAFCLGDREERRFMLPFCWCDKNTLTKDPARKGLISS